MGRKTWSQRVLNGRPEITGRTVWFCPNKNNANNRLQCVINRNGTISVSSDLSREFESCKDLAEAIRTKAVVVENNFKLPRDIKSSVYSFSSHLYFLPNATLLVAGYLGNSSTLPENNLGQAAALNPEQQQQPEKDKRNSEESAEGESTLREPESEKANLEHEVEVEGM